MTSRLATDLAMPVISPYRNIVFCDPYLTIISDRSATRRPVYLSYVQQYDSDSSEARQPMQRNQDGVARIVVGGNEQGSLRRVRHDGIIANGSLKRVSKSPTRQNGDGSNSPIYLQVSVCTL